MRESKARQGGFNYFAKQLAGRDLNEPRGARDELQFTNLRANGEDPAGAVQTALVRNLTLIHIAICSRQRDRNAIRRHDQLEMLADVLIELLKTLAEIQVVINGQGLRVRIEPEGAKASSKPHHLEIELFRMAALGVAKMAKDGEAGVDRVHKPKGSDFLRRKSGHASCATASAGKRRALFVKDAD